MGELALHGFLLDTTMIQKLRPSRN